MASSYISNALQINFDSVLGIQDNDGMVNMFRALEATGLRGFLGCPSVLYEQELEQFFDTALIQDRDVTCAISGKYVEISAIRFAGVFNIPTDGLIDFSEVPSDLVLQARTMFSRSGKPVLFSCKKRLLKYEFRLLNDILAKSITVKESSFDAITHESFLMMTAIHFGINVNWSKILFEVLKEMVDRTTKRAKGFAAQICVVLKGDPAVTLGEAKTFPTSKIISTKTVNTYVDTNKKIDARGETDEPDVATIAIVKKNSVSKKRPAALSEAPVFKKKRKTSGKAVSKEKDLAIVSVTLGAEPIQTVDPTSIAIVKKNSVSKKRPAALSEAPVFKKKRKTSGKAVSKEKDLAIVSVTLGAEPIQTVDPTSAMPAAHPPAPKRKAPKRKLRMTAGSDDEFVEKESAVETAVVEQSATTSADDVDTIIEEVIAATAQMEQENFVESVVGEGIEMETVLADPVVTKSDDIIVEVDERSPAVTDKEDFEPLSKVLETPLSPMSDDESLTIEKHLAQIPEGMMLPSLTSTEPTKIKFCNTIEIRGVEDGDWYRAHLPKIAANDKGKGSLEDRVLYRCSAPKSIGPQILILVICEPISNF
ncbi:hypothetical protein F511_13829 [Dorcoceras hygrometricum]|uniref:Dystroglycan-like n=1 Tax=Dorcoceras hygrometricum TaxID=472368 RepID=A0A2Z7C1J7_9LAMI|nr:hypothetical protein F511_13829 [Dorcoceras hygrometricum]